MLTRILQDLAYFFEIPLHHSKPFLSLKNSGRRSPTNPSSSKVSLAESPSPIGVYPSRAVAYRSLPKSHLQRSPSPSPSPIGVTQVFVVSIDLISEEGSAVKCSRLNKSDKTQADVPPPPPPSEDPQPKLPPPNTPENPAAVPMPNPPPAQQPDKTVRGRAKRSRLSTCSPTRRSSRFNKPDTSQADQGTPVEPSMPPPSEDSGPADPPPNTPETPAAVPMPNPPPAQQLDKTVRGRAKRSRSSTCSPIRRSSRFNKPDPSQADQGPPVEPSVAAETVQRDVPPPILQQEVEPDPSMSAPSKSEPPKQPESTVPLHNPLPVAHDLPPPPSEDSQPADPPPNTVRGRAKRSRLSTCSPTRRSSRFNKPDPSQADQGTPPKSGTPNSVVQQHDMTERGRGSSTSDSSSKETPNSPLQPEAGDPKWDDWPESDATQQGESEYEEDTADSEEDSTHPAVVDDDGGKRGCKRIALRDCEEALDASGRELDDENATGAEGQAKRRRVRGQKSDVRRGRVPNTLWNNGPILHYKACTNDTIKALKIAKMTFSGKQYLLDRYRTYNMFPVKARLEILKKFLQSYSWGEGESVKRCLQVFETIAADAYSRELVVLRGKYTKKYTEDKLLWRDFPPQWCKNPQHWKGLCLIWSKDKWDKMSSTNRNNKTKDGSVIHHLGGSRSLFRHKCKMESEKGSSVTLKEVFDRIHTKETHAGKVYVNKKAEEKMALYEDLKENYNARMSDEDLWDIAVDGEDAKGRLFGFGHRSRTCKGNKELAKEDATLSDHAKSTATSAEDESTTFTKSQVVVMIKSQVAAERRRLLADIAAQEARHNADREEFKKKEEQNKKLFAELFKRTGAPLTTFHGGSSKGNDGGGASGGGGGGGGGGDDPLQSHDQD
ncbi:Plant transposase (Ptta/En/Spm family) [Carex littledalei]|uniref:Plant transposase (Ptta/En/Spm family) n=1 Tax=Carex littledalei TaxID=544730 RepID=A0A833VBQ7_9POAL|nr:Plant transposase (Ptta/En/Spm family) [Carex littledalei]